MGDEIGEERLHLPRPDLPEEAALPEPGLDQIGPGDQGVPVSAADRDIDDQPVLGGEMADDPVGVGQDGVVAGQRGQDVRFDPDAAEGFVEQDGPQDRRDGGDQGPAKTVALEKHHLDGSSYFRYLRTHDPAGKSAG